MKPRVQEAFEATTRPMEQIPAEIEPFAEWLALRRPHNAIEIGVRHGGTSSLWCGLCDGVVVGIDWDGRDSLGTLDVLKLAIEMETEFRNYRFILGDSHKLDIRDRASRMVDGTVDFLFIDGDHSYEGVCADFAMYSPLVRPGGCVAFHDIVDTELIRAAGHGVYRLWTELRGKKTEFCVSADWGGIGALEVE